MRINVGDIVRYGAYVFVGDTLESAGVGRVINIHNDRNTGSPIATITTQNKETIERSIKGLEVIKQ